MHLLGSAARARMGFPLLMGMGAHTHAARPFCGVGQECWHFWLTPMHPAPFAALRNCYSSPLPLAVLRAHRGSHCSLFACTGF